MNVSTAPSSAMISAIDGLSALYGVESVATVCANAILIVAICKTKQLQTQESLFMSHLLCWDMISGSIGFSALCLWRMYPSWCAVPCAVFRTSMGGAFGALGLAMTEKYIKICHPFRYATMFTTTKCVIMLIASNLIMLIFYNLTNVFLFANIIPTFGEENTFLKYCSCPKTGRTLVRAPSFVFSSFIFVCICVMSMRILREAHRQRTRIALQAASVQTENNQQKHNFSRAKFLSLLSLFAFLAYVPVFSATMTGYSSGEVSGNEDMDFIINLVVSIIAGLNNIIDPLAFLIITPLLKKALLKCCKG